MSRLDELATNARVNLHDVATWARFHRGRDLMISEEQPNGTAIAAALDFVYCWIREDADALATSRAHFVFALACLLHDYRRDLDARADRNPDR